MCYPGMSLQTLCASVTWSQSGLLPTSQERKLYYCPALLSSDHSRWYADRQGRAGQGTASDTFINSHTNTGIPARFFAFCCFPLHGILDTSPLLRIPQIPFLTLDCTMCSLFLLYVFMNAAGSVNSVAFYGSCEMQNRRLQIPS